MKKLIQKWLDIPTQNEIDTQIKTIVDKKTGQHYRKIRKACKDRHKSIKSDLSLSK